MTAAAVRVVRILRGVHAGAERSLVPGEYVLGSGAECDIVLRDDGIAERHIALIVGPATAYIKRQGDAVWISRGKAVKASRRLLSNHEVLCLGDAELSITAVLQSSVALAEPGVVQDESNRARAATPIGSSSGGRGWPMRWALYALACSSALLATFLAYAALTQDNTPSAANARRKAEMQKVLQPLKLDDLKVSVDAKGTVVLSGYVKEQEEVDRIRQLAGLYAHGTPLMKFHVGNHLEQRAREFLDDPGLEISYQAGGKLRVTGASTRLETKFRQQQLVREMKGIVAFDDSAVYIVAEKKEPPPVMPVKIVSIYAGYEDRRYFKTDDATKYFEGSVMSDGAEVVSIDIREIVFKRAGKTITFPLADTGAKP
jgi:type III secretion system YscD/HrpQ family protein